MRPTRYPLIVALTIALIVGLAPAASATFPGSNGDYAYRAVRPTDTEYRVYVRSGPTETALTRVDRPAGDPSWSPNGERIVFIYAQPGEASEVWTMRADGTNKRALTDTPNRYESRPVYSPNGKRIAFVRGEGLIFVMNADGTGQRKLIALKGENVPLSWSPDGRSIATVAFRGGQRDVVLVRVATGTKRWITNTPKSETEADWSPSGRRLVFSREVAEQAGDLFTMRADGSRVRRLTTTADIDESDPVWAPEGDAILFIHRTIVGNLRDLAVMAATPDAPADVTIAPGDDFDPSWQVR